MERLGRCPPVGCDSLIRASESCERDEKNYGRASVQVGTWHAIG